MHKFTKNIIKVKITKNIIKVKKHQKWRRISLFWVGILMSGIISSLDAITGINQILPPTRIRWY